jgi:YggT family protein
VNATVADAISAVVGLYSVLIIIYVLMSWFPMRGFLYDVQQVLASVVEPYLSIFRRFIPPLGNVDISPIVAYFVLVLARNLLVGLLKG